MNRLNSNTHNIVQQCRDKLIGTINISFLLIYFQLRWTYQQFLIFPLNANRYIISGRSFSHQLGIYLDWYTNSCSVHWNWSLLYMVVQLFIVIAISRCSLLRVSNKLLCQTAFNDKPWFIDSDMVVIRNHNTMYMCNSVQLNGQMVYMVIE